MFDDFLKSPEVYEAAELYWTQLCWQIIGDLDLGGEWKPWLNKAFADGTKFRDGDPIHSLISSDKNRALRILQIPEKQEPEGIDLWFGLFDETRVMALTVALNEWRARLCVALLSVWLDLRVPTDEAERIVRAGARSMLVE